MSDNDTPESLTLTRLKEAVRGNTAAIRLRAVLVPAGGADDKVFPPTYEGGKYALEERMVNGQKVPTVLLDSVQSQANRLELALLRAYDKKEMEFPLLRVDFSQQIPEVSRITALDAPHRIADAIFRECTLNGAAFRQSTEGSSFADARLQNATALFGLCPTALVFGVWDSTGPLGGLGAKFARALVSEIVGVNVAIGKKTASRLDPLISKNPQIFNTTTGTAGDWTANPADPQVQKDAEGKPVAFDKGGKLTGTKKGQLSAVNLGSVTPDLAREDEEKSRQRDEDGKPLPLPGGITLKEAVQTTVLSLPALRRLQFPLPRTKQEPEDGWRTRCDAASEAARTVLAALALAAIAHQREEGYDLRSRCLLIPQDKFNFEFVLNAKQAPKFLLDKVTANSVFTEAVTEAVKLGLPWRTDLPALLPSARLVDVVRRSRGLAMQEG